MYKCALILAAGQGTRIKSDLPKVLHKVCGKEMVNHVIDTLRKAKIEDVNVIVGKGAEGEERGEFSQYADLTKRAIHVQKTIIRKLSDRESCVIIGRSADYILKEHKPILRVFINSPDEVRIKNVMESHKVSEKEAKQIILETDKRYHKRHMALSGSNRGDRHNRDILIDSSLLGVDGTARLIETLAKQVEKQ